MTSIDSLDGREVSEAQRRFLVAECMYPNQPTHLQHSIWTLSTHVDADRLRGAFSRWVNIQAAMRTTFKRSADGYGFYRHVHPQGPEIEDMHMDMLKADVLDALQHGSMFEQMHGAIRAFDTTPLARLTLVHTRDGARILAMSVHHAVFDGQSGAIFYAQLRELYLSGDPAALLPAMQARFDSYDAFVAHEKGVMSGDELDTLLRFWARYLNSIELSRIVAMKANPLAAIHASDVVIGEALLGQLKALATHHGLTLHLLLLGCFQWAVAAFSNTQDILTSTPTRNRLEPFAQTIGCFVNPVIVRQRIERDMSLLSLLLRLRPEASAAYRHSALPVTQVSKRLFPDLLRNGILLSSSWFAVQIPMTTGEAAPYELASEIMNLQPRRAIGAAFSLELHGERAELKGSFLSRQDFDPHGETVTLFKRFVEALAQDADALFDDVLTLSS